MIRQPGRRAVLAVRAVKVAATAGAAGVALALTLGGAIASTGNPSGSFDDSTDGSAPLVERLGSDSRCTDAAGKTIVRTRGGETRAVSFEHGWRVYRGERPGTLVVVCPG